MSDYEREMRSHRRMGTALAIGALVAFVVLVFAWLKIISFIVTH